MPIYVYRNLNTGETFEWTQRMTDPALTEHPETGEPVKRLIQPVGIAFKGSGFYVNDSRSGGTSTTGTASRSGGSSVGSTSSASAPSKEGGSTKSGSGASSSTAGGSTD